MNRRVFGLAALMLALSGPAFAEGTAMRVQKDPSCGCCTAWADLAREAGYDDEWLELLSKAANGTECAGEEGCEGSEVPQPPAPVAQRQRPRIRRRVGLMNPDEPPNAETEEHEPTERGRGSSQIGARLAPRPERTLTTTGAHLSLNRLASCPP